MSLHAQVLAYLYLKVLFAHYIKFLSTYDLYILVLILLKAVTALGRNWAT